MVDTLKIQNVFIQINGISFIANLAVFLDKCNSYEVLIQFLDVSKADYNTLKSFFNEPLLNFKSEDLENQGYDITQISIEEIQEVDYKTIIWKAVSGGKYRI